MLNTGRIRHEYSEIGAEYKRKKKPQKYLKNSFLFIKNCFVKTICG